MSIEKYMSLNYLIFSQHFLIPKLTSSIFAKFSGLHARQTRGAQQMHTCGRFLIYSLGVIIILIVCISPVFYLSIHNLMAFLVVQHKSICLLWLEVPAGMSESFVTGTVLLVSAFHYVYIS